MERGRDGSGLLETDIARRCANREIYDSANSSIPTGLEREFSYWYSSVLAPSKEDNHNRKRG